jgi:hypothetical protein
MSDQLIITEAEVELYVENIISTLRYFLPENKGMMVSKFKSYFSPFSKLYTPEEFELDFQRQIPKPVKVYLIDSTLQSTYLDLCMCELRRLHIMAASKENLVNYELHNDGSIKVVKTKKAEELENARQAEYDNALKRSAQNIIKEVMKEVMQEGNIKPIPIKKKTTRKKKDSTKGKKNDEHTGENGKTSENGDTPPTI